MEKPTHVDPVRRFFHLTNIYLNILLIEIGTMK